MSGSSTIKTRILFVCSVVLGLLIWPLFAYFLETEPWDTNYGSLLIGLLGFCLGAVGFERPNAWPIGLYLGQFLYGSLHFLKSVFFYSGGGVNFFIPWE